MVAKFWWKYYLPNTFYYSIIGFNILLLFNYFESKKIINDYQVGEGAIAPIICLDLLYCH